ncbi:MAG: CaiB/BaiF CoA transferase family protein [Oligoflexales bacterium]
MKGILKSLKILDFTTMLPGPLASLYLADLGAQVLRIESPEKPDPMRSLPPFKDGKSVAHSYLNRSKRSLSINLKKSQAREIIFKLVEEHDVLIEQFRPGVMERLGLGYKDLSSINPRLIYISLTGYGQNGPLKDRAGHDINYLGLSGASSYSGTKAQGPVLSGLQLADMAGGSYHVVMGLLAAVIHRLEHGEGQYLDVSMSDSVLSMQGLYAASTLAGKQDLGYESHVLNGGSYYDYYESKDGRYFTVGSLEPKFLKSLVEAIGCDELLQLLKDDPVKFKQALKEQFALRDFAQLKEIFATVDACVEPVLSLAEACEHEHFRARNMFVEVPKNELDTTVTETQVASPFKFSKSQASYSYIGRKQGADTASVLKEIGLCSEQINVLRAEQVI